jgi:hypothetical protein
MTDEPKDYVVWYTRNFSGDCVIFWRPDGNGYTTNLDEAGRYTKTQAEEIATRRGLEKAVPLKAAEAAARRHVTADGLRGEMDKLGLP